MKPSLHVPFAVYFIYKPQQVVEVITLFQDIKKIRFHCIE